MLVAVFGKMGSGKTLLMTIMSELIKSRFPAVPVYSNYHLKNQNEDVKDTKQLISISNGVISLDEFWITMDSRVWDDNVFLTHWINQTRKKNLLVFYTTQNFKQIDIRVRHATDLLIFCEKFKNRLKTGFWFRFSFISNPSGRIMKTLKLTEAKARLFYDFYNSFEVVEPLIKKDKKPFNRRYPPRPPPSFKKYPHKADVVHTPSLLKQFY